MRLTTHRFGAASAPVLVLLHGVTASHRTWWRIAPMLAGAGWQVLALDLRCHGSSPCDGPIRGTDAADDVAETLDGMEVDVLWGHSLGARTAMQLLGARPMAARRAVLEDPPGRIRRDRDEAIANWQREVALARDDPERFVRQQLADNPIWDERDARENAASVAECEIDWVIEAFAAGYAEGAPDLAPALRVPSLLVLAEESRSVLTGDDRAETIAELPAGSRVVELPGGHTLHRDLPGDYLHVTLDWLGGPRSR
jgi:pimeloyl-ACP methyl ester carboxylesterase